MELSDGASTLSNLESVCEESLPSLPGFRSNRRYGSPTNLKKQTMKYINKQMFLTEAATRQSELVASNSATSLSLDGGSSRPRTSTAYLAAKCRRGRLADRDEVLCFRAYFVEKVHDSTIETERIRRCEIYFYVEDGSLQVVEPKLENSGVPQGNFMHRRRVPRTPQGDEFVGLKDLTVGAAIELYGRSFRIYSCNASTRDYLLNLRGVEEPPDEQPPVDRYEALREELMSRETGKNPEVSHNIQKNSMKLFAEAALGNTVDNSGRLGFIKYGTSVLRFYCYWDDSASLYGDVQLFKLHYFLYDDTVEVLAVHAADSGRDKYPLLLKRAKLPKPAGGYYHWRDLAVGLEIDAYARKVKLVDADRSTRDFYRQETGRDLGPRLPPPIPAAALPTTIPRALPPPTGFGSEEDSLTSCAGSLVQKPPHKPAPDAHAPRLRYRAAFAEPKSEDLDRTFVLVYDLADSTVQVRETPRRNSGIVGGTFLAKLKVPDAPPLVGTILRVSGHTFRILDADEATFKYMEAHPTEFPIANISHVRGLFADYAAAKFPDPIDRRAAIAGLLGPKSELGFSDFEAVLESFLPKDNGPPKHAAITFWRAQGKSGALPADALLSLAE